MKYYFLPFFLFYTALISAQSFYSLYDDQGMIDSLKTEINHAKTDSIKAILSFKLSNIYLKDGNEKLYLKYLKAGQRFGAGNNYLNDISYYFSSSKYIFTKNRALYQRALEEADSHLRKYSLREVYSMRSMLYRSQYINLTMMNKPELGFKILLEKAVPMAKNANDSEMMGILCKSIAITFYNDSKFDKAEFYIKECIKNIEKKTYSSSTYSESLIESYLLYSEILITQGKFQNVDNLLRKTQKKLQQHPNSNLYPSYYYTKGLFEHSKGKYKEALIAYDEGIRLAKLNKDNFSVVRINLIKYDTLKALKRFTEARDLLLTVINSKDIHIIDKKNCIRELSWLCKKLNDLPKSLFYVEEYIKLSDSLNTESYEKEIASLEAKYKDAENQKKIHLLEIQKKMMILDAERNKWYHLLLILVAVLLLVIVVFLWRYSKNKGKLAKQKEINYIQNLESLKSQKTLDVMQAMIDGQEKERTRLARDLHDGVGSRLSSLKMQMAQKIEGVENKNEFNELINLLTVSITELRQVAFNLVPEALLKLGLEAALKDLCCSMSTETIKIYFTANEIKTDLKSNDQITIFRIVQELINNALKHSGCTEVIVDCSQNNNLFLIVVEDNGKGFKNDEDQIVTGLGINNIKNRIALLNGKMEIQSIPNMGSVFNIELQINNE